MSLLQADELREQVNRELQRCNDGTQAMQGVLSLLCERLITVERQLAMFQVGHLDKQYQENIRAIASPSVYRNVGTGLV